MGIDVMLLGPLPTPAVAMLTRTLRAHLGVMISASHNPFKDNGIKFFAEGGVKLDDALAKLKPTLADYITQLQANRAEAGAGASSVNALAARIAETQTS